MEVPTDPAYALLVFASSVLRALTEQNVAILRISP